MAQASQAPSTLEPAIPATMEPATVISLPRFCADNTALWFLQVQNKFRVYLISSQTRQFELLLEVLPQHVISEVIDILMVPLFTTPYDDVKNTFMTRLVEPEEFLSNSCSVLNSWAIADPHSSSVIYRNILGTKQLIWIMPFSESFFAEVALFCPGGSSDGTRSTTTSARRAS